MDCLAIDLGTKTGYAYNRGALFCAGTKTLASSKEITAWGKVRLNRRCDPRIERLCELISGFSFGPGSVTFDVIVFEDVQFVSTTYQAHLWAGLRSAIWLCGKAKHFDCVPVGTLKLFATGNGAATKSAMGAALHRQFPDRWRSCYDDNAIDAIWLHIWAQRNLNRL